MVDIPNHVAIDPASPHYWKWYSYLGVRFKGIDRPGDVSEFNVEEGWVKLHAKNAAGKLIVGNGGRITVLTLKGKVEPYFRKEIPNG